jgi:uncharacterized membrane protein
MPEWLIVLLVFFVVSRVIRGGRRCVHRGHHQRLERSANRGLSGGAGGRYVAPPKAQSPMEALQRRYVDGSITVEEYERELDRMLRK